MNGEKSVTEEQIQTYYEQLKKDAESGGYNLNPDIVFTKALAKGLLTNIERYGYQSCPCRLSSGVEEEDRDIICPCDYRDPDLNEFGACYCGLYVTPDVASGKQALTSIPERRPRPEERQKQKTKNTVTTGEIKNLPLPVFRCKVCGYLCARDSPPEICPICKAKKERFERFL